MKNNQYITRKQLKALGFSSYLATVITKSLTPITRTSKGYFYDLRAVITAVRNHLDRPRIKSSTRQRLSSLLSVLLQRLGNVVTMPFCVGRGNDGEVSRLGRRLYLTLEKHQSKYLSK